MKFVAPSRYCRSTVERWNPWRALRASPELEFALVHLPAKAGGALYMPQPDGWAAILVDVSAGRVERNALLAHELCHHELGGGKEAVVHRRVAERLVPVDELRAFIRAQLSPEREGVTLLEIAEEFDVTEAVARRAVDLLHDGRE